MRKEVNGYEGVYEVDSDGIVYSLPRFGTKGGIVKQYISTYGYSVVYLSKDNKCKTVKVHRIVAEAFINNPDAKPQVNHIDGDKQNNRVSNLEWVTSKENILHSFQIGHSVVGVGERNPSSKLTNAQCSEIKALSDAGVPQSKIASQYGISQSGVCYVLKKFGLIEAGLAIDKTKLNEGERNGGKNHVFQGESS